MRELNELWQEYTGEPPLDEVRPLLIEAVYDFGGGLPTVEVEWYECGYKMVEYPNGDFEDYEVNRRDYEERINFDNYFTQAELDILSGDDIWGGVDNPEFDLNDFKANFERLRKDK